MKAVLIRHGRTEANEKRLYCGSTDIPLSQTGITELDTMKCTVGYPDIAGYRIITSGMKRCDMTLAELYGKLPQEVDFGLREMDFGVFEMRSYEQLKTDQDYIAWITGDNEANIVPGGESGNIMKARVIAAFNRLIQNGGDVLVVTHGGPIAAIMEDFFPLENKNRYEWQPQPGRGYLLELELNLCRYEVI